MPVSPELRPCLAAWELRSRSACWAMARGSWPSYSLDMVGMEAIDSCGCVFYAR